MFAIPGGCQAGLSSIKVQLKLERRTEPPGGTFELIVESYDNNHSLTNASRADTLHCARDEVSIIRYPKNNPTHDAIPKW